MTDKPRINPSLEQWLVGGLGDRLGNIVTDSNISRIVNSGVLFTKKQSQVFTILI